LTGLNASQLTTGIVPIERLPVVVSRLGQSIESNEIANGTVEAVDVNPASFNTTFWRTVGNAGTTAGTHFLGTTDNQPLEIRVNGLRALRLEDNGDSTEDPGTESDGAPNLIGGSPYNFVGAGVVGAVIAGGGATNFIYTAYTNGIQASFGVVSGGMNNVVREGGTYATIGGGQANETTGSSSSIGGGLNNEIGTQASFTTISGGIANRIQDDADNSVIAGGRANRIGTNATSSSIGGGRDNKLGNFADYCSIVGGRFNSIGTNADWSAIGGGYANEIPDETSAATIPGGQSNFVSGDYALAAGYKAHATNDGALVWSDSSGTTTRSEADNSVTMRASGGYRFFTGTGSSGAQLAAGDTAWSVLSDRKVKKDIQSADCRNVLETLARVPVQRWRYEWEDESTPLHLGPMAQEFKAAFYPGREVTSISTLEFDGVALAAIQGLNQKLDAELKEKESEVGELKRRVERLELLLPRLGAKTPWKTTARRVE
jgi:hypothetical protein